MNLLDDFIREACEKILEQAREAGKTVNWDTVDCEFIEGGGDPEVIFRFDYVEDGE